MTKKEQLTELVKNEVKKIISEVKKKKKPTMEGMTVEGSGHVDKDDLGIFFVVLNPSKDSTNENLMFETDLFNFTEKIQSGKLALENIRGIFKKEERARKLSERFIRERVNAINDAKSSAEKLKGLRDEVMNKAQALKQTKLETQEAVQKLQEAVNVFKEHSIDEKKKSKPSAGLTKKQRSNDIKKARSGQNLGKGNFDKVASAAGGGEKGKKIAASRMWSKLAKKQGHK